MYLGEQYVNNLTLSDVTFLVDGQTFHAHRIALLASSDTFRAMFDGHYKEKEASTIPIPNIRYTVFESMMRCIYTGAPVLQASLPAHADNTVLGIEFEHCIRAVNVPSILSLSGEGRMLLQFGSDK